MAAFLGPRRRQARRFRDRPNFLEDLSDKEIVEKYRLSEVMIYQLLQLIEADIQPKCKRSHALPSLTKLLVTLQFLAKSEFYSDGGLTHGISKSSVCRSIWQVIDAIDLRLNNINFPTSPQAIAETKRDFARVAGIPNCLGAVDGTHIAIIAPRQEEASYVCRKGYHSINVQTVVDAHMRPATTIPTTCFQSRTKTQALSSKKYCKLNAQTRAELAYNTAHSRTRQVIERSFGVLKSRFRCLDKTGGFLQVSPAKAAKLFVVCAKLNNMCLGDGNDFPLHNNNNNNDGNDDDDGHPRQPDDNSAVRVRDAIIAQY